MDEEKDMEEQVQDNTTVNTNSNTQVEKKGFNITSMILGIVSVVLFCLWYVSLPCSIIAIIFSIAGRKDAGRGMGIAGLVLGIIALVLRLVLCILVLLGVAAFTANAPSIINSLNTMYY